MSETAHEQQFHRWVSQHQGLIFRVVHASAELSEDKRDLAQEILVQLWRSIPSWEERCKETTWIYRVALNTARAWRRSEKRRREKDEVVFTAAQLQWSDDSSADPRLEQLYAGIRQLPKADRSLLLLHLDGLSYREMSEVLGVTESCVGVRLTRAKQRLIETMKGDPTNEL